MTIFTKGAPEKLASMCKCDTVPRDFNMRLMEITAQGYRVIAIAFKEMHTKFKWMEAQKIKRELVGFCLAQKL